MRLNVTNVNFFWSCLHVPCSIFYVFRKARHREMNISLLFSFLNFIYYDKENVSIFALLRSSLVSFPMTIEGLSCAISHWLVQEVLGQAPIHVQREQLVPEKQPAVPLCGAGLRGIVICALWLPGQSGRSLFQDLLNQDQSRMGSSWGSSLRFLNHKCVFAENLFEFCLFSSRTALQDLTTCQLREEPDENTMESGRQISYFTFIPSDRFPVAFV